MITVDTVTDGVVERIELYHRWDVLTYIMDWSTITDQSKGQYLMFDDGTELIVRITGVNKDAVRTTAGVFRITDLVHLCIPKNTKAGYSGMFGNREHLLVRPLGRQEKGLITRLIGGENLQRITPRITVGARDRTKNELTRQGFTVEEATTLLIEIARKPGNKQLDAVRDIFHLYEIDTTSVPKVVISQDSKGLVYDDKDIENAVVTKETKDVSLADVDDILSEL